MDDRTVGVLGGGQLGRMMSEAASRLGVPLLILDPAPNSPAKQINAQRKHLDGSFSDPVYIRQLAEQGADILTVEIEHVDAEVLSQVQLEYPNIKIYPSPATIRTIQDKYTQKKHLIDHGVATAKSLPLAHPPSPQAVKTAIDALGLPLMLKARTLAYDGRGNFLLRSIDQIDEALTFLGNLGAGSGREPPQLYAEQFVPFTCEIAVMVVRGEDGTVASYPAVETIHKDNICHIVNVPLRKGDEQTTKLAQQLAEKAVSSFGDGAVGIFGVEMFLVNNDNNSNSSSIVINEIAPRPHNSGHYTIEACETSQFENHLRAILGFPIASTSLKVPSARMLNVLGASNSMDDIRDIIKRAIAVPGAVVHNYGKTESRKGRKMGHITITGSSDAQTQSRLNAILNTSTTTTTSSSSTPKTPLCYTSNEPSPRQDGSCTLNPTKGFSHPYPLISIIMGSDSDLNVMKLAAQVLQDFNVPYELDVVSAHRTPKLMYEFAQSAAQRGVRYIIAGAGGAAHLPGMVAALSKVPVIGVPIRASSLDGLDSLLSIVQMPRGVPVATVAINNSTNAALLALRLLAQSDSSIAQKLDEYIEQMEESVTEKRQKLVNVGWDQYSM